MSESAGQILLPIALSPANPYAPVTVTYAAVPITAFEGSDYTLAGGSFTIAAGTTSAAIPITIVDDADAEGTEQFQVRITAAPGAKIAQGTIVVQIDDDDTSDPDPDSTASTSRWSSPNPLPGRPTLPGSLTLPGRGRGSRYSPIRKGSVTVNRLPRPTSLSTATVPPSRAVISRT